MKVAVISDTHCRHSEIQVPDADLLIHCGDFTGVGSFSQACAFNHWLGTLPHKHKVVIAGNHELMGESDPSLFRSLITNATYLQDEEVTIDGIRIWGAPWTPIYGNWAFMLNRVEIAKKWALIPDGIDILVTHGPPRGFLDQVTGFTPLLGGDPVEHAGCKDLLNRQLDMMKEIRLPSGRTRSSLPRYHVFGHIHEAVGRRKTGSYYRSPRGDGYEITFINAAQVNGKLEPNGNVQVFDIEALA